MKNLVKVFSALMLALGMLVIAIPTQASAAPSAKGVYSYRIIGMADQEMYNNRDFLKFPDNAVETDGTIYVKINQMGYGSKFINIDGKSATLQEVESEPIIEYSSYGKIVAGWNLVYKVTGLSKGIHDIEFGCIGANFPSKTIKDYAKINIL